MNLAADHVTVAPVTRFQLPRRKCLAPVQKTQAGRPAHLATKGVGEDQAFNTILVAINVYGKRSKRVIEASPTEESNSDVDKPDRIPLIHRMKKRENGLATTKTAVRPLKSSSPQRAVTLAKQRVAPAGSPTKRRGTRLAEILAQEAGKQPKSGPKDWEEEGWKRSISESSSRVPLSTITTNTTNSPVISNVKIPAKASKKKVSSPKSLVTSKTLSTVEVDITVLDMKGKTVKQEERTTRTDIIINRGNKSSRISQVETVAVNQQRLIHGPDYTKPLGTISIESSLDESVKHATHGSPPNAIVQSSGSSAPNDSERLSLRVRRVRKQRRALANVIISDESEDSSSHEDTYIPPDSPLIKNNHKPAAQIQNSTVPGLEVDATARSIPKPSGLRLEVVIPPAPYKVPPPAPLQASCLSDARNVVTRYPRDKAQGSSNISQAKPLDLTASLPTTHEPRPSRYPPSTTTYTTSYNLIPSPPPKARQLTPIRRSQSKGSTVRNSLFAYGRGVPSSPTTPTDTDFDLSVEFSQLDIGISAEELEVLRSQDSNTAHDAPEYLKPLLEECFQEECGPYEFSSFIESFPLDPILNDARIASSRKDPGQVLRFKKIGEASYSEVFGIGDVVLKVIPLRDESRHGATSDAGEEDDGPAPTDAKDVRKEIIVTRAMGEVHGGFVKLLKTYVVRGKYPEVLLKLWDEYNEAKGSESVRPDTFTPSQTYAIIVLPNNGPDLETYVFSNASKSDWRKASSIFWQVAKALAYAEKLVSFEHRDLHWGQILVKDIQPSNKAAPLRPLAQKLNQSQVKSSVERIFMDDLDNGVQTTVIDLGLSRMDAGDGSNKEAVHWTPFDDEIFMGEGDHQFDIYRLMKSYIGSNWEGYHPLTNVMWLHYLVTKLLRHKNLKAPSASRKPRPTSTTAAPVNPLNILQNIKPIHVNPTPSNPQFTEKECHDALVDIEEWLGKCVAEAVPVTQKPRGKGRSRKTTVVTPTAASASTLMCSCAGQVVGYGVKRGWIRPVS
ncbi:hypothetical protein NP233_g1521 [Leucocoprinus birnbaumii]|uniref:non-specific serine/threonine protein kinase n=1 Tax=Leucocoprinus birnbaumii TaxID=56174 RepID=A0AAD5YZL1_9AGAR|nr:hypothetical protein NP233_g1521 [Leucocoprinus birnbaumii]